jgi:ElaB/YqjD/DUF883 family membrane-anchored ribosome-binding protein
MGHNEDKRNGQKDYHKTSPHLGNTQKSHENRDRPRDQQKQVYSSSNSPLSSTDVLTYEKFEGVLRQVREIAVKEIVNHNNLVQQVAQKNNELTSTRDELRSIREENEKELSFVQKEIARLQADLNDKVDLIHYLEKQTGGEAVQKVHELQKQVQNLKDDVRSTVEKAVRSIISINGDVGAFSDKFLGDSIYCYPESNDIILNKSAPDEIRLYDLMGVEFPQDKESLQCIVVQKGWRDSDKVWVEAKLSITE